MEKQTKTPKSGSSASKSNGNLKLPADEYRMDTMLEKFFIESLRDILYAEKAITKALPKMAKAATTSELKEAFGDHLASTHGHIKRLEQVFDILGKKAQSKKCEAIEGLQKEAESIIEDTEDGSLTRDVGLIMAAQKVEHYEIAAYGSLAQLAVIFGMSEIAGLLQQTLDEEKDTDQALTFIAENNVNYEAAHKVSEEKES